MNLPKEDYIDLFICNLFKRFISIIYKIIRARLQVSAP